MLGENLAAIVVAVMYAGGNVLEDVAVARAERDLKSLVDRAPRIAHRRQANSIAEVPIEQIAVGDTILVRGGEVIPIDGIILSLSGMIDEAVLTGEPIPVMRHQGEPARSGTVNAGDTFEMRATATAGESAYAGIVKLVNAAQTAKAPFIRLADRYALLLFPVTLLVAGGAWLISGDPIRGLAVLVAATPCPLIWPRRCVHCGRRAGSGPRHPDQGGSPVRSAGSNAHRDFRQDRNIDGRGCPACSR